MKSILLALFFSFTFGLAIAQKNVVTNECCSKYYVGLTSPNIDNSVYTAMQNIWYANERISYICPLPKFHYLIKPIPEFRDGEGKNGFLFDANIYQQIPVFMGRNHANHGWQTTRLNLDYSFNIRMALDSSNPLLPNNDIIGLSMDKVLWDSHTQIKNPFSKSNKYSSEDWNCLEERLQNISLNVTLHHYSNGQPPGFYFIDTTKDGIIEKRNDYKKGDFSTNYLQLGLTYSCLSSGRNLFSFKMAYQRDDSLGGPFAYSKEEEKSYGKNRLVGFIQYRLLWRKINPYSAWIVPLCKGDSCDERVATHIYKSYEFIFRFDYEYILGDLTAYPNIDKYRFNPHLFIEFTRPNWRALGFVVHGYYGRDYSNIRYDLPVWTVMGGISINFNKYRPAFSDNQRFSFAP